MPQQSLATTHLPLIENIIWFKCSQVNKARWAASALVLDAEKLVATVGLMSFSCWMDPKMIICIIDLMRAQIGHSLARVHGETTKTALSSFDGTSEYFFRPLNGLR